jgi:hypothetical protein
MEVSSPEQHIASARFVMDSGITFFFNFTEMVDSLLNFHNSFQEDIIKR